MNTFNTFLVNTYQARKEVGAIAKDIQAAQKQVTNLENKVEMRKADRHAILTHCRV